MPRFGNDVSEYQVPLSNAYPRDFVLFRLCDGARVDRNVGVNLAWAIPARTQGRLVNFGVYVVYRPGMNAAILATIDRVNLPRDCVVMIDVESWGGQIRGDHSGEITALGAALRARQSGRPELAWGYANRGDDASVFPTRPAWMPLVIASYGRNQPANPGPGPLAAWQYTDGQYAGPAGWPTSTPPFGACDHNAIYLAPGPNSNPVQQVTTSTEDDMFSDTDRAMLSKVFETLPALGLAAWAITGDAQNPGIRDVLNQIGAHEATPQAIAAAVVAALPPASTGGITTADVETAVRTVFETAFAAKGN